MIWNVIMHALIGLLGTTFFHFTPKGVAFAVLLCFATQGVELFRVYRDKTHAIKKGAAQGQAVRLEEFKKEFKEALPRLYLKNVGIFTVIVIFAAELGRYYRVGV